MIRDCLKNRTFWDQGIDHYVYETVHRENRLKEFFVNEDYRAQYTYDLAKAYFRIAQYRYSRGDPISELSQYIEPLLNYWEESNRLGKEVWSPEQTHARHMWAVNLDFYIDCFWLIGVAFSLNIPDVQWQRLLALIGNEGQDVLLDKIIATRQPDRKIGTSLCYSRPYARLLEAINAPQAKQAVLLNKFVEHWYNEVKSAAKSGRQKQALPYKEPYWHGHHTLEGGYFGYWCLEAIAAVKAFNLDDSLCTGHPHYPGDLLHPSQTTTADATRLPAALVASINAPAVPPVRPPETLSNWQAFKMVIKNKFNS
jgi:Domain of unknown function (DUF1911)/Domain of unknown function (DUF1910)